MNREQQARIIELEKALLNLYEKYVVDLHGEHTCDCDTHVEVCAPCIARAALAEMPRCPNPDCSRPVGHGNGCGHTN